MQRPRCIKEHSLCLFFQLVISYYAALLKNTCLYFCWFSLWHNELWLRLRYIIWYKHTCAYRKDKLYQLFQLKYKSELFYCDPFSHLIAFIVTMFHISNTNLMSLPVITKDALYTAPSLLKKCTFIYRFCKLILFLWMMKITSKVYCFSLDLVYIRYK